MVLIEDRPTHAAEIGDEGIFDNQALMAGCNFGHNPVACGKVAEGGARASYQIFWKCPIDMVGGRTVRPGW